MTGAAARFGDRWELRLYVAGQTPRCVRAMEALRAACDRHLGARYQIEVIDLLASPRRAAEDQILAVPTVVRRLPVPVRRIVGDLSDTERLLAGLQLRRPGGAPAAPGLGGW